MVWNYDWLCDFSLIQEIWNSPYSNDSFPVYAEDIDAGSDASPSTAMLSEVASLLKITIVGGSIPERSRNKLYNTCCIFGTDGMLIAKHRKVVWSDHAFHALCENLITILHHEWNFILTVWIFIFIPFS